MLDIVESAKQAGSFRTLVTALVATDLDERLKSDGPFTVFAPTDDAFAELPAGTVERLLADPERLTKLLQAHVVDGLAADTPGPDTEVIRASNGVIHVIDRVLVPSPS